MFLSVILSSHQKLCSFFFFFVTLNYLLGSSSNQADMSCNLIYLFSDANS